MSLRWSLLLFLLVPSSSFPYSSAFQVRERSQTRSGSRCHSTDVLQLASSSSDDSTSKDSKPKGVYVRPSAVIEKGSGFFFPGLEGPRVRLVVGSGLLLVTAINHVFSSSTSAFSEGFSVVYSLLVLFQGAIETGKEGRIETIAARDDGNSSRTKADLSQQWGANANANLAVKDRAQWAAAAYLSLTAATHMILLQDDNLQYWLGVTPNNNPETTASQQAAAVALATARQSKGGRVALPTDHPAGKGLLHDESDRRCVILQRINHNTCWMVASDDLLASFTKQDLLWLGQLAGYVNMGEYL